MGMVLNTGAFGFSKIAEGYQQKHCRLPISSLHSLNQQLAIDNRQRF